MIARSLAGEDAQAPTLSEQIAIIGRHLQELHALYGAVMGPRIARKHMAWFLGAYIGTDNAEFGVWKARFNALESAPRQFDYLDDLADWLVSHTQTLPLAA